MRSTVVAVVALAAGLTGCGGGAGELLTISTSGGGGPGHRFVVTGDGRGSCDGGAERVLPSDHVLDAREVERELRPSARVRADYTAGAPPGARRYVAATKEGLVTWAEGARRASPAVGKAILLTQELKRDLCAPTSR
jgi:hypothetical protein